MGIMDRKTLLVGIGSFLLIGMVAVWTILFSKPAGFRGTIYAEPYPPAPVFALTRADGTRFLSTQTRGEVTLLFFGYTSCPDVCPTTLAELNQAMGQLGGEADRVQVVFVTVDPGRDTPSRVQEYVNHFNPDFIGLSGTEEELTKVWSDYGVYREIVEGTSALGYLVDHTARVTLIDPDGNLRISFSFETPVDDIVHDLKLILKEGE
jgi:protein SCO1/2